MSREPISTRPLSGVLEAMDGSAELLRTHGTIDDVCVVLFMEPLVTIIRI
jgi:hypothetical protein